ncbi:hypothetical protein QA649_04655 [Bradyrhizobium sp. CB1717]|uniref:hypothetical protein n=1 Tax=Bradyrhizobium sp. CB1717 TaxID=3039154 RepID=UPI0024B18794|nr:hypothetical protein [Bradyrhizobium sp. CB1717]WFU25527.1 hypothetical protein QA649_04655 [Bradyrhizobium sp. CB1717]
MSNPNWFSWFSFPFFAPLSGSVTQDIASSIHAIYDKALSEEFGLAETLFSADRELKEKLLTLVTLVRELENAFKDEDKAKLNTLVTDLKEDLKLDLNEEPKPAMRTASKPAATAMGRLAEVIKGVKRRRSNTAEAERALDRLKEFSPKNYEDLICKRADQRADRESSGG